MKTIAKMAAMALFAIAAVGCKPTPKYALTDGQWELISWNDTAGGEQMVVENRPTMKFGAEAKLSGNAGCNNFAGRYQVGDDQTIEIDLGALTRKMCLDMTLEDQMVRRMPNVDRFKIDGNQLILFAGEREIFRFDNVVVNDQRGEQ